MFKNIDLAWREQKVPVPNTDGGIRGCWPQVGLTARFCFSWETPWWEQNWWSAEIFIRFACSSLSPGPYQLAHTYPVLASGGWLGRRSIQGVYNADHAFPVLLGTQRGVSASSMRRANIGPSAGSPHRHYPAYQYSWGSKHVYSLAEKEGTLHLID